ncbi:MAG: glycoside hydrolase family 9 protein [Ruminococcus sp.]|nr:glycoside hydrolase family 9 protein [Ruminococcus sp.]
MKTFKKIVSAAMCAAVAVSQLTAFTPAVNAAEEIADSLANDSGLDIDYARALQYSIYFYDANMCGTEVNENNRYKWRGDCHTYDSQVPMQTMDDKQSPGTNLTQSFIDANKEFLDPDGDGFIDVAGGFHDAGDHVKFGMPENYAASTLGWGYYEFRDSYVKTGQDDHIETILRYFNDYLMKCTFRDDSGKVIAHCYQVGEGGLDHAYWNSPEVDQMARPAWFLTAENPQTDYVVSAAGSLALNYLNFKDTDAEYAEKCLDYATALMDFAMTNKKQLSINAEGPMAFYNSSKWEDDYCWAAAWMFIATKDVKYLEDAVQYIDYYAPSGYCYNWNDMWAGAISIWGVINQEYPEYDVINMLRKALGKTEYEFKDFWDQVERCLPTWQELETPGGYAYLSTWGSARYNTAMQLIGLVYDKYTNDGKPGEFSEWAKGQMEYIMGDNPLERSYIVGYNENSVKFPHHRAASGLTKCEDPDEHRYVLYGALAGGPDGSDKHNDTTADWIYNEVTIDYNAAFVGACAGLYEYYGTDEMQPTKNFPPDPKFSGGSGGSGGGNGYWVNACGIDDLNGDGAGVTKVSFMVMTDATKVLDNTTVRYFYSGKGMSDPMAVKASKLYDQSSAEAETTGAKISGPHKYDKTPDTYYFDFTWDDYNIANSGKKYQFSIGLYYGDKWNPDDDWSYDGLKIYTEDDAFFGTGNEVRLDNICVYTDGELIGGIEPDGSVPVVPEPTDPPTETPTEAPTEAPTEKPTSDGNSGGSRVTLAGDANCDDDVTMADAAAIFQSIGNADKYALSEQGSANADVDGKKGITASDAITIQKFTANLISSLPIK